MERTLPRWRLDWRMLAIVIAVSLLLIDAAEVAKVVRFWILTGGQQDWGNIAFLDPLRPFDVHGYVWSPLAAWPLEVIAWIGYPAWTAAHFAVLLLIRDWRIAVVYVLWWPFWNDAMTGNSITFAFVAAWLALSGSRWGTYAFMVLTLLMPRPLMLPTLAWLLWKRPETRIPFASLFVVHAGLVLASGQLGDWIRNVQSVSAWEMTRTLNVAPSRLIGIAWAPTAAVLAMWLTWKGRIGFASLAACVYLHAFYLGFALLEFQPRELRSRSADRRSAASSTASPASRSWWR